MRKSKSKTIIEAKLADLAVVAALVTISLAMLHLVGVLPVWCLIRAAAVGCLLMSGIGLSAVAASPWRDNRSLRIPQRRSYISGQ